MLAAISILLARTLGNSTCDALVMEKLLNAIVPPTEPCRSIVPEPAMSVRGCDPLRVSLNVILPPAAPPVLTCTKPVSIVTGPSNRMLPPTVDTFLLLMTARSSCTVPVESEIAPSTSVRVVAAMSMSPVEPEIPVEIAVIPDEMTVRSLLPIVTRPANVTSPVPALNVA